MQTRIRWTRLPFRDGLWMVYSPRFSRTYVMAPDLATSTILPPLFGLSKAEYQDLLPDPARSVDAIGGADSGSAAGRLLPRLYLLVNRHRTLLSVGRVLRLGAWYGRLRPRPEAQGATEIGRLVRAVERKASVSDCYPRALLTAYLCIAARLDCELIIGILAPTKNMHAWCSVGGSIPYEPSAQHWFYRPVVVFDVTL